MDLAILSEDESISMDIEEVIVEVDVVTDSNVGVFLLLISLTRLETLQGSLSPS
jgi:hypothetical protein